MLKEIRPDGTVVKHQSLTFSEAKKIVGGYVEVVNCPYDRAMLVNEDGRTLGLEPNPTATVFYYGVYAASHPHHIVGTVIYGTSIAISRVVSVG